jgi:DNA-binding transcriptional LysR family regulator
MTGEIRGVLIIGASTTIAEYMLPALLGDFKKKYPDVNVHLRVSNSDGVVSMVENNDIDLGVVESPVLNKNLMVEECRKDRLVAIVTPQHPLAAKQKIKVPELLEYAYIAREEGSGTREVIQEYLSEQGMNSSDVHISIELGSPEAIKGAVEAGMGVAIVSEVTIHKELQLGTLVALELDPQIKRPFSFVHQKQKFRQRAMDELLEFARAYCLLHQDDS